MKDRPMNTNSIMVGSDYNEAGDLEYEVINRVRTVIMKNKKRQTILKLEVTDDGIIIFKM